MTEIDKKTFDLGEVLAGRGYPETQVYVYFDEKAGYAIQEANERLTELSGLASTDKSGKRAKEYDALEEELGKLIADLDERKFTVKLKGTPPKVLRDILKKIDSKHPPKKDAFGREEFSQDREDMFKALLWQSHITQIVDPSGGTITPNEEDIQNLFDLAPTADIKAIDKGISDLSDAGGGFEVAARGTDFLSKSSPED